METLYCVLPYFLLGAAMAGPVFWWLVQHWRKVGALNNSSHAVILWLTPTCAEALGECAAPGHLRRMSTEHIAKRLNRFDFPATEHKPDVAQYSSWPTQAELLHSGNYSDLKSLQENLIRDAGEETPSNPKRPTKYVFGDLLALLMTIILLLLAFISATVIAKHPDWCTNPGSIPCTEGVTGVTSISFDTDLVFDFNHKTPISDEHTNRAKTALTRLLNQYNDIKFKGISAQTDPIGSEISNRPLADKRAEFVRKLLVDIVKEDDKGLFVDSTVSNSIINESIPSAADYQLWNTCFKKFQLDVNEKPLEDLPADRNPNNRPLCLQSVGNIAPGQHFPACRRLMIPKKHSDDSTVRVPRAEVRSYALRAEYFRELTACLAPMRHVLITFEHTQKAPSRADDHSSTDKGEK
ncbi:hypothetical protein [Pseudomonas mandelii]|uniref:hypothetical protein n=1 Tax=Pseudomonas mandelii TaxID=75612 RepID=UPI00224B07EE|nr:hypothetical protein [Pseudomonas mandelii]MCX2900400.1 hypothetical protein [Pseudomonas mandelii]